MKNYYSILGVAKNASRMDIRKAYLQKAKLYHPDLNSSPSAPSKFKEIQEAYNTLYDSNKRREYDSGTIFSSSTRTTTSHNYNTNRQYRSTTEDPFQQETFEEQFRAEAERLRKEWQRMEDERYRTDSGGFGSFNRIFDIGNPGNFTGFPFNLYRFFMYFLNRLFPMLLFPLAFLFYFTRGDSSGPRAHRSSLQIVYDSYGRAYTFDKYGRRYRIPEFDRR